MDIIVKLVNLIGTAGGIAGGFWALIGVWEFFQGRKNGDKKRIDDGLEGIMNGGILGVVVKGVATGIASALSSLSF